LKNGNVSSVSETLAGASRQRAFSYDDRFIYTRNVLSINENNIFNEIYYILDTKEKALHGPFGSIEEFKNKLNEFEIVAENWYRTSPDPNIYNKSNSGEKQTTQIQ